MSKKKGKTPQPAAKKMTASAQCFPRLARPLHGSVLMQFQKPSKLS